MNITEFFQNPDNNELLWLAVFICLVILLIILWIVSRRVRLWYWKVDAQIDTLERIDKTVQQLGAAREEAVPAGARTASTAEETVEAEKAIAEIQPKKNYTEQELEKLIRD